MTDPLPRRKVTQDDVADRAGVTRSMVSYVLNGSPRTIAPETRERILRAIEDLGYRPNKAAQSLGTGKDNPLADRQIGVILNRAEVFLRPYYTEILAGIHAKAHEEGYHIRFIRFFDDLRDPILFNSLIHGEEVCGLVLLALDQSLSTPQDEALVEQIRSRVPNMVCVEWQWPGLTSVTFDRHEAARTAAGHLLGLGHRQVAYIGEEDERVPGFRQAMAEAGLAEGLALDHAATLKGGFDAAARFFPAHPEVTAVVAGSDEVALGLLRWLGDEGIEVPGRVAVVSIDDIEWAEFASPPLTTIRVEKTRMGRMAVQLVIQGSLDPDSGPSTTLLPCQLIVRRSCGAQA